MWGLFPFFYYDVLARIIPGAFTLAVILKLLPSEVAGRWIGNMESSRGTPSSRWALYMIGVVYEVLDSFPWLGKYRPRDILDNRAFQAAWNRFEHTCTPPTDVKRLTRLRNEERWRIRLWEKLVYEAARKVDMLSVFWHCHRFQGEYKMFYHLIYPALFLAAFSLCQRHICMGIGAIILMAFFIWGAFRRDERRWWQLLSFAEQLDWLKDYYEADGGIRRFL
jgi:hypothetical protein